MDWKRHNFKVVLSLRNRKKSGVKYGEQGGCGTRRPDVLPDNCG
jgi:hypothetical protein